MNKKSTSLLKNGKSGTFPIVAIGASTGGLEAMSVLLKNLSADTGMAYIYVQHLNPDHESLLTSLLSKITKMKVQDIDNMEKMLPDHVYIIPYNKIIKVTDGHIQLLPRPKNSSAISIDVLFSSLAKTHHNNVIGVVLSGNGKDGSLGLKAIKEAGGLTFAQDASAQAKSMPDAAIETGVVDFVLSPKEIALEIIRLSKNGIHNREEKESNADTQHSDLNTIFELLLKETGVDFSHYKLPTIKRRLNHKMLHYGVKTINEYAKFLLKDKKELTILYKDLLINVTSFFRDTETFRYLKSSLLPKLLKAKTADETLRIWVPACSTGEEAYSIAMMLVELQDVRSVRIPIQIFATDLSEEAIRNARTGEYSPGDLKAVPKKYQDRFFEKKGEKRQVIKELREMCVFAPHNILRDPPFSRMDFISCRNLLIYFDAAAQKKVFASLHFALNETGFLMLGKAETIGTSSLLFNRTTTKFKIYLRKKNNGIRKILELTPRFPRTIQHNKKISPSIKITAQKPVYIEDSIDSVLLSSYMPACAVVNKDLEIIQFRGSVNLFLEHPSGKASLNILKMARPEFTLELRNAIHKAIETKQVVHKTGIEIKIDSVFRTISFEVNPLKIEWDEPLLLIVFTLHDEKESPGEKGLKNNRAFKDSRIQSLVEELNTTRSEMNAIIEAQETTYEELQAANEEIVSSNEEFQTLNEELETSKEEIEATNEELLSTNQELQLRNELITELNEYSEAIIATLHEPMLVLYKDFRVKSANKVFYEKFKVKPENTEGISLFELGDKQWNIPQLQLILNEIISKNRSFENFEVINTFSGIGEKIMLLNAHLIIQKTNSEQLILLAIDDITEQSKYYLKEKYALSLIEATLDPLVTINTNGKITDVNEATVTITGISREKLTGTNFFAYFTEPQKARKAYQQVFSRGFITDYPLTVRHRSGKLTEVLFNGSVYKDTDGRVIGVVVVARDVTEQKRIASELVEAKIAADLSSGFAHEAKIKAENASKFAEEAVKAKQQFLSNMSHEIRTPMNAIIGFTKVLLKSDLSEKQKEYLSAIKISGDALIVLINDILDLAKVDAGKMTFEHTPFKMAASVSAMLHLFETKIHEKNLELVLNYDQRIPEVLVGDYVRLHQIILNLMSNAIKFTAKGKITFSVHLLEEDDKKLKIEFVVADTGIGIHTSKISKIFENFQQASTGTSRIYGGTGLGLSIVKQLVEPQGGTVQVKSKLGKGSVFSFTLSFGKTNEKAAVETCVLELDPEIKNVRVLVVEDIALNQLLMRTLLDEFGFSCDIASTGKIAVEKLMHKNYDIILMDLQMPEMNGFEATSHIRNKMNLTLPIIALTADVTTVDLEKCKAVGMNDYISKPVEERLLYSKIVNLIKQQKVTIKEKKISGKKATAKTGTVQHISCINLDYLNHLTKSDPSLMMEMIGLYLEQTPPLIQNMKKSFLLEDWDALTATVHKMIPSFSIIGISSTYEDIAKKVQLSLENKKPPEEIKEMVLQLESVCVQACNELENEFNAIKQGI